MIEKRFADALGIDPDEILSIVIPDKGDHQKITNAFRKVVGYVNDKAAKWTTETAKPNVIWEAIYKAYTENDMSEYLPMLKEFLINNATQLGDIDWLGV